MRVSDLNVCGIAWIQNKELGPTYCVSHKTNNGAKNGEFSQKCEGVLK